MPKKSKEQSLLWKATKATFKGIGRGTAAVFKYTSKKIKESEEKRELEKNPTYKAQPIFGELKVLKKITGDFSSTEADIYNLSVIALIFGKRGSGKSALGFRILENIWNKTKRRCYVLGMESTILPSWIGKVTNVNELKNDSVVLVDEGAVSYSSRESMSSKNKELSKLMAIARHKDLTLIFVTQNTGMIDKNILKLADILLIKEGSLLQLEMERPEIKKFYEKTEKAFKNIKTNRKSLTYIIDSSFEGVISFEPPSFWTANISKNRAS